MTQDDLLIVAGMAGLAIAITLVDLLLSLVRSRRSSTARANVQRPSSPVSEEGDATARTSMIRQRLSAIQDASSERTPPAAPVAP